MNTVPQSSKLCYRCENVVRLTPDEFRAATNERALEFTICPTCRMKLEVEAGFAGSPIEAGLSPEKSTD